MGLLRNLAHTLLGIALLTALWITSLAFVSSPATATSLIADLGAKALNPWLVSQHLGLSQSGYAKLEAAANANPSAPLNISFIKPDVPGAVIKGLGYTDGVQAIYQAVAKTFYNGGTGGDVRAALQRLQRLADVRALSRAVQFGGAKDWLAHLAAARISVHRSLG